MEHLKAVSIKKKFGNVPAIEYSDVLFSALCCLDGATTWFHDCDVAWFEDDAKNPDERGSSVFSCKALIIEHCLKVLEEFSTDKHFNDLSTSKKDFNVYLSKSFLLDSTIREDCFSFFYDVVKSAYNVLRILGQEIPQYPQLFNQDFLEKHRKASWQIHAMFRSVEKSPHDYNNRMVFADLLEEHELTEAEIHRSFAVQEQNYFQKISSRFDPKDVFFLESNGENYKARLAKDWLDRSEIPMVIFGEKPLSSYGLRPGNVDGRNVDGQLRPIVIFSHFKNNENYPCSYVYIEDYIKL